MQLKRETDYALRLLIKMSGGAVCADSVKSVRELCVEADVPYIIASRILSNLKEKGVVCIADSEKSKSGYYLNENASRLSLYELILIIEGNAELFAVFDKSNSAYDLCRERLLMTEKEVQYRLCDVSLTDLIAEQ